ncbi:trigger factor [bacterium]|jgi:trigger factor|nr:trigger factor [bacterium]MBT6293815.1 trigger factor [bacterium]
MKIEKNLTAKAEIELKVTLDAKEIESYLDQAAKEFAKNVQIKGFRKGHVPRNIIEENYGKDVLIDVMLDLKLSNIYQKALEEEKIIPISSPRVDILDKEKLIIQFTSAAKPEVDTKGLDKVKVKKEEKKVAKKDLDLELENMLLRFAEVKEVERKSKNKDEVVINFEGFDEKGESINNTKGENYPLKLGSNSFIPGFEEGLVGAKKGDKKDLDLEFPKDYHAEDLKGKKVTFKVEILKVNEKTLPELNEEIIEKISHKKQSKEDFLKDLENRLQERNSQQSKTKAEEELYSKFLEKAKVTVSDLMIKDEEGQLSKELEQNAQRMQMPFDSYKEILASKEGKTFEEFLQKQATERVQLRAIIQTLMEEHKIEVAEKDLDAEITKKSSEAPKEIQDQVKEYYKSNPQAKEVLKNQMKLDALLAKFM